MSFRREEPPHIPNKNLEAKNEAMAAMGLLHGHFEAFLWSFWISIQVADGDLLSNVDGMDGPSCAIHGLSSAVPEVWNPLAWNL